MNIIKNKKGLERSEVLGWIIGLAVLLWLAYWIFDLGDLMKKLVDSLLRVFG